MAIDVLVKAALAAEKGRHGAGRMFHDLGKQNNPLDIKTINIKFEKIGSNCKGGQTIQSDYSQQSSTACCTIPIGRDVSTEYPDDKWVADSIYIQTTKG